MTDSFRSNTTPSSLIPNRLSVFGGLMGGLLPWQRVAMDQQAILGAQAGHYGISGFEIAARGRAMQNALENIMLQAAEQREARRAKPAPWGYWQFKNGKIGKLDHSHRPEMKWGSAWDRSLGAYVFYDAR